MLLSVRDIGQTVVEILFYGPGENWEKNDLICTRLCNTIKELHEGGRSILIDMDKVHTVDNTSANKIAEYIKQISGIKIAFYNTKRFVRHSFQTNGIPQKLLFDNRDNALASFT